VSGGANGVFYTDTYNGGRQLGIQLYSIVFTIVWSLTITVILLYSIDFCFGLRVSESEEEVGLDASIHGETLVGNGVKDSPVSPALKTALTSAQFELSSLHDQNKSNHSSSTGTSSSPKSSPRVPSSPRDESNNSV
jgi:hypothetical protein